MGDEKPAAAKPSWRGFAFLVAGLLLALGASVLAQRTGLGKSLELDFKGIRAVGTAEPMGDDYNIRYEHPDGTIFRRLYTGRLSGSRCLRENSRSRSPLTPGAQPLSTRGPLVSPRRRCVDNVHRRHVVRA